MSDLLLRPAVQNDEAVLWDFIAMASYEPDPAAARAIPVVASYLIGWRRATDFGLIAERNGLIVGATWARYFPLEAGKFWFDERTFELSIGVREHARGQRVGETLVRALIAEATRRDLRLSLNVRAENPARRVYERLGFQYVPDQVVTNRTGGQTLGMIHDRLP